MSVVNPSQSNAGDVITAGAINNPINQIAAVLNGGIDATNITPGSLTAASLSPSLASAVSGGYTNIATLPTTITNNGNGSYAAVFPNVDLTNTISPGFRIRTTRATAAGVQSSSLNGTTQYWSKATPAGMTFGTTYTASAWVKLTSYVTAAIITRTAVAGTNGWRLFANSSGQVTVDGFLSAGNSKQFLSYQSIPLNKWVHVAASLDMTGVGLIYINGASVPVQNTSAGTATTLTQAGNLEVGSQNGGTQPFPGKIAQAAVFSSVLSQATIQSYMNQTLVGTEPTLISAYSFSGNANDLNTTSANNLTSNGSVTATAADAPWGGQANGTISSIYDYAIVQAVTFSTNTTVVLQVPEGCTIDTRNAIAAVVYSSNKVPFGFPSDEAKWTIETDFYSLITGTFGAVNQWAGINASLLAPIGAWSIGYEGIAQFSSTVAGVRDGSITLATVTPANSFYATEYGSIAQAQGSTQIEVNVCKYRPQQLTVATAYSIYGLIRSSTGAENWYIRGEQGLFVISAKNAYL